MYLLVPPGGCFPETRRIELGPQALTIGRALSCDVRVDVPGVDEEHAKISEVALVAMGADCAVGDVPLEPGHRRLVMPGDEIQIGSIVVALEGPDPSIMPPPPDGHEHGAAVPPAALDVPRVRVVEGSNFGEELVLGEENREYVIGRSPKADLVLDDREVSREHVKLLRKGYTVLIKDQSSTRGSWLGRSAVYQGSTVEWTRPRMLRVGVTVLSLELPEAIRRTIPGAQASAPMTPPPRSRSGTPYPRSPLSGPPPHPSDPPGSLAGAPSTPDGASGPPSEGSTQKIPAYHYQATPQPSAVSAPGVSSPAPPPVAQGHAPQGPQGHLPQAHAGHRGGGLGALPKASNARRAWKGSGPTIGKASGLLLLALAGLAILGALFVVFSLLE